jgi:hypothetical protein
MKGKVVRFAKTSFKANSRCTIGGRLEAAVGCISKLTQIIAAGILNWYFRPDVSCVARQEQ